MADDRTRGNPNVETEDDERMTGTDDMLGKADDDEFEDVDEADEATEDQSQGGE